MAAPKTGVISASILITKNSVIERKGIRTRLFLKPGADNVRLVINKLVNDIVVLKPDNITLIIAISCAPRPVNLVLDEKGVIKVQPDIVKVELLVLAMAFFFVLFLVTCVVRNHSESDTFITNGSIRPLIGFSKNS